MDGLSAKAVAPKPVMIDATHLSTHRTATSLRSETRAPGDQRGRPIGRTKGGMNTNPHAAAGADVRPIRFFMIAGQVSDPTGAARFCCTNRLLIGVRPSPGQTYPTASVTGNPGAVKPFRTATRTWNAAT